MFLGNIAESDSLCSYKLLACAACLVAPCLSVRGDNTAGLQRCTYMASDRDIGRDERQWKDGGI